MDKTNVSPAPPSSRIPNFRVFGPRTPPVTDGILGSFVLDQDKNHDSKHREGQDGSHSLGHKFGKPGVSSPLLDFSQVESTKISMFFFRRGDLGIRRVFKRLGRDSCILMVSRSH